MKRRITKKQEEELMKKQLPDYQRNMIKSMINYQKKVPQLTNRQWEVFEKIYNYYVQRVN